MQEFARGDNVFEGNSHPAFEKIQGRGYSIWYRFDHDRSCLDLVHLTVQVWHGRQIIGEAEFTDDGSVAYCRVAVTDLNFRRQGIASAMYVFAEKAMNRILTNHWDGDSFQTDDAKALWTQPNRPFGNYPTSGG